MSFVLMTFYSLAGDKAPGAQSGDITLAVA